MEIQRFKNLWERCGGNQHAAAQIYAELSSRYGSPGRYYHTPRHISQCLRQFDAARTHIAHPDYVEAALWFHDVVYDPKGKDNEHRSAELFLNVATDLPAAVRQSVSKLIMATIHPNEPKCPDQQFIVDIDLSSFGLPWSEFLRDSKDVRAEFPHLPHELFVSGQGAFLGCLMARDRFYLTSFFQRRLEAQARANIRRYLGLMVGNCTVH